MQDSAPAVSAHSSGNYMLGNIMPFGNPSFTAQNRSGSDMCLNVAETGVRDGQKNSVGGGGGAGGGGLTAAGGPYMSGNMALSSELGWLDLDNTSALGLSPTLHGGNFGSLHTHSNPGSLPHDQFHSAFMDDGGIGAQVGGMMDPLGKGSNPTINGFDLGGVAAGAGGVVSGGGGGGLQSFLEPGMMHQSGLYPSTEEERLLELGLSR